MDLETAEKIAERVSKRMKKRDLPIQVRTPFVIMMAQVMKEIRREERRAKAERNEST